MTLVHPVVQAAGAAGSPRRRLASLAAAVLALCASRARADDVLAGIDLYVTRGCGTHLNFGGSVLGLPTLPANFFDPGSDPFSGDVPLHGNPLVTAPPAVVDPTDTIVERLADAILPLTCGPASTVPAEIVALSLTSGPSPTDPVAGCGPITVTYFGGTNPEAWDVDVALSSIFPQSTGSLTIRHDCPEGGDFDSSVPVTPKVVFTRQSDSATRVLDLGVSIPLVDTTNGHWQHFDPGYGALTTPGGFLVDHDGDSVPTVGPVPGSTNFFPGLRHLPCDCAPGTPPYAPRSACGPTVMGNLPYGVPGATAFIPSPPIPGLGGGPSPYGCDFGYPGLPGYPYPQPPYMYPPYPPAGCPDTDADGLPDNCDDCPATANPDQQDTDDDTVGDACEAWGDHYVCYKSYDREQNPPIVTIADQFGSADYHPKRCRPKSFCAPASKNDEPVEDFTTHLRAYKLRHVVRAAQPSVTVDVTNQFGTIRLEAGRAERLLVPTSKSLVSTPAPPDPQLPGHQHYLCHKVRTVSQFTPIVVTAEDQFSMRDVTLKKPILLCNPASKNGSSTIDPTRHLLCYAIRRTTSPAPPAVFTNNQFGPAMVNLNHEGSFCVPSTKAIVGASTTTTTTTTSTTTTTTLETFCCDVPPGALGNPVPVCLDAVLPDVADKCNLLGGTLLPGGFLCDPDAEQCAALISAPPNDFCCECPVPAPPFPHAEVCFEGVTGHEFKCQPPCVLHPAVACGPVSEKCGGSPSGAFLDPTP